MVIQNRLQDQLPSDGDVLREHLFVKVVCTMTTSFDRTDPANQLKTTTMLLIMQLLHPRNASTTQREKQQKQNVVI